MMGALAPMIGAGISAVGGWLTNRSAQHFAAQQRSTAYQTAVQDATKAGLNPMLMYQQGPAASLSPSLTNPLGDAEAAGSAFQRYTLDRQTTAAEVAVKSAQANLTEQAARTEFQKTKAAEVAANQAKLEFNRDSMNFPADVLMSRAQLKKLLADTGYSLTGSRLNEMMRTLRSFDIPGARWEAGKYDVGERFGRAFPKGMDWMKYIPGVLGPAVQSAVGLKYGLKALVR